MASIYSASVRRPTLPDIRQKSTSAPRYCGFLLISRCGPVIRSDPPVTGHAGLPGESRLFLHVPQNPLKVSGIVGSDTQFRTVPQGHRQTVDDRRRDNPALVVTRLGPGVREQDEGPVDGSVGQTVDKLARVIPVQPDIPQIVVPDIPEQLYDTVDKRLAADNTGVWIVFGLPGEVFTATEADFEPYLFGMSIEQAARRKGLGFTRQFDLD